MAKDTPKVADIAAEALAVSLDKPLEWAVGFLFGNADNTKLNMELWSVVSCRLC